MMKIKLTITCMLLMQLASAQTSIKQKPFPAKRGLTGFPELIFNNILGAPKLTSPLLISGDKDQVLAQGFGLAGPALYDWDGDGLKDLLIGEFATGTENGLHVGSFVRVYKNAGTEAQPAFGGRFDYARPPFKMPGNGTPYSVDQYCCIGFTPQFVDLNNDGLADMITGSYYGEVIWYEATKQGFKSGIPLPQQSPADGDPRNGATGKKSHQFYWIYSSASFGDLDGDGKNDLVIGGRSLRMSKNIGTATKPKFGMRELLLDEAGHPLKVHQFTTDELRYYEDRKVLGYVPPESGDEELSPYVTDWDNDGVPDILATNTYMHQGLATVDFFKGVKTKDGIRFKKGVPLFTTRTDDGKAFPGMGPRVSVADYNGDGINDLLIGVAVVMTSKGFNDKLSWEWQTGNNILPAGKNGAILATLSELPEARKAEYIKSIKPPEGVSLEEFMTLRHEGRIYVMLGKK